MPDIFTQKKRSEVMSRIRGTGNKGTELRLIRIFRANGITGWRRGRSLALRAVGARLEALGSKTRSTGRVKPDFVFPELKVAVFVDGCFWHGCPNHGTKPKTRASFWLAKITGNRARDRRVNRALRGRGWTVVRVWEHELRRRDETKLIRRLCPCLR
jgi:DNA mismatch endonuclease (patch repair protein)